jgi:hypothetical protein
LCIVGSSSSHSEKYPVSFAFSANDYDPKKSISNSKKVKKIIVPKQKYVRVKRNNWSKFRPYNIFIKNLVKWLISLKGIY